MHFRQLQRQPLGNAPAADHHDGLRLMRKFADAPKQLVHLMRHADGGDHIAGHQRKVAVRNEKLVAALHRTHQNAVAVVRPEVLHFHAAELALFVHLKLHQFNEAVGKRLHLRRHREAQRAGNFLGGGAFRVDGHGKPQLFLQQHHILIIFLVAHARDGMLCAELFADHTADEIRLIRHRRGDQQIGAADICNAHLVHIGLALNHNHIQRGGDILRARRVAFDHGNIVPLQQKLLRNGVADLAGANDHDFQYNHRLFLSFRRILPHLIRTCNSIL